MIFWIQLLISSDFSGFSRVLVAHWFDRKMKMMGDKFKFFMDLVKLWMVCGMPTNKFNGCVEG